MDCILSIDQGTQSTRVFVYDSKAAPIASHQEEFAQIYPQQGCDSVTNRFQPNCRAMNGGDVILSVQVVRA